jgi:hypothetical protein
VRRGLRDGLPQGDGPPPDLSAIRDATDLRVHARPEGIGRRVDAVQLAEHVAESGLRFLVMLDVGMVSAAETARVFRAVGPERTVSTTDLGQVNRVAPAEGRARFAEALTREGIGPDAIELAMKRNPRALLAAEPA